MRPSSPHEALIPALDGKCDPAIADANLLIIELLRAHLFAAEQAVVIVGTDA